MLINSSWCRYGRFFVLFFFIIIIIIFLTPPIPKTILGTQLQCVLVL